MQYNNLMLQRLNKLNNDLTEDDIVKIDTFASELIKKLHLINDCVLIRIPTFDVNDMNKIKKYVTDEIGLEACQNEINLNVEMCMNLISTDFALNFFITFNRKLKDKYNYVFCSILSVDDNQCWIFRFHRIRNNGTMWINSDLNEYSNAILYEVF